MVVTSNKTSHRSERFPGGILQRSETFYLEILRGYAQNLLDLDSHVRLPIRFYRERLRLS